MAKDKKIYLLILMAAGFAVYAFNLNNQLFWDDDEWIKGNLFVHDFRHLREIFTQNILSGFGLDSNYYRPFLLLSFAFNYALHGLKPLGYHLFNNGLHIASGVLIFLLLQGTLKRRAAFLAALLFLIHPLQTEAVTYISGRGDSLSVFFMLLALWLFIKAQALVRGTANYWLLLAGSLLLQVLAVLSRETAALFPIFPMIYYIAFLTTKPFFRAFKEALIKSLPYWATTVVYFILRLTVFNFKNTLNFYSQANEYTQHLSYRLYTFGGALWGYFKLIFAPVGLHMERDLPVKTSLFQWPVPLAGAILSAIILVGVILFRKSKHPTPNTYNNLEPKLWFFGWFWFFAALGPVSGIIPINALIYEHWLYLPLIGFFTLAGFYIDRLLNFLRTGSRPLFYMFFIFLVGYLGFLGGAAAARNLAWGDPPAFYEDTLRYSPDSVRVINNLGNLYSERGELDKAIAAYEKAVNSPSGNIFAQPHYNLGNIYRDRGQIDQAVMKYRQAMAVDPNFPFAFQNLAVIEANRGNLAEATTLLEKVKTLRPREPKVYYNLALLYLAQNQHEPALSNLRQGLAVADNEPEIKMAITTLLDKFR